MAIRFDFSSLGSKEVINILAPHSNPMDCQFIIEHVYRMCVEHNFEYNSLGQGFIYSLNVKELQKHPSVQEGSTLVYFAY